MLEQQEVRNSPGEEMVGELLSASSTLGMLSAEVEFAVMLNVGRMLWSLPSF